MSIPAGEVGYDLFGLPPKVAAAAPNIPATGDGLVGGDLVGRPAVLDVRPSIFLDLGG